MVPLLRGEKIGEKAKGMSPGVTYLAGSSLNLDYEGLSEPWRDDGVFR